MDVISFIVQQLSGVQLALPQIGVLVCVARNGTARWLKPKRRRVVTP